jgi:hypothetical protein
MAKQKAILMDETLAVMVAQSGCSNDEAGLVPIREKASVNRELSLIPSDNCWLAGEARCEDAGR